MPTISPNSEEISALVAIAKKRLRKIPAPYRYSHYQMAKRWIATAGRFAKKNPIFAARELNSAFHVLDMAEAIADERVKLHGRDPR